MTYPRRECGVPVRGSSISISLRHNVGRNTVEGDIRAGSIALTVTGRADAEGWLVLTGQGTGSNATVTLDQWRTRDTAGVMTGTFAFTQSSTLGAGVETVVSELWEVVKPGVTPPPHVIPAVRVFLQAQPTSANKVPALAGNPAYIGYSACFLMENLAPLGASLRATLTPIGPDGRDYAAEQTVVQGLAPTLRPYPLGAQSGCGLAFARDYDTSHKVAPRYRLRVDYVYEDGFSGFVESTAAITNGGT